MGSGGWWGVWGELDFFCASMNLGLTFVYTFVSLCGYCEFAGQRISGETIWQEFDRRMNA